MNEELERQSALVEAAQQGDTQARDQLYHLAMSYLRQCFFRHARRCYGPAVESILEDIMADAMEKSFQKLNSFTLGRVRFTTWIYGFAKNVLRGHYQKESRRERIWASVQTEDAWWNCGIVPAVYSGGDPQEWMIHQEKVETMRAVRRAMRDLPGDYQVILDWTVVKQKEEAETAKKLDLSKEEMERLKDCALALLRERFFRYQYGDSKWRLKERRRGQIFS